MSLPVQNLDNRKFQDLVDEAKRRIPELCPEWTNHNVSDPGVALIELFAWMTEMTVFRLNQVPDVFFTRMLNLIGFERFPAKAARVDLTFWLSGESTETVHIPKGVPVTTTGAIGESRVFTTLEDSVVAPPALTAAFTAGGTDETFTDVWDDLRLGIAPVTLFPRTSFTTPGIVPRERDSFYLGFENSLAGNAIRLDVRATVQGIGVKPAKPPLIWEIWQGEGWMEAPIPDLADADTTGGLNRDGSVLLLIPNKHEPTTVGGVRAHWLRARLLPQRADRPYYQASPRIDQLSAVAVGATVEAEHSEVQTNDVLGISTGKPDQRFFAQYTPALPREPHEYLEVVVDDKVQDWEEVSFFVDSTPTDTHYTWDSYTGEIRFGPLIRYPDGSMRQHGAIPPEGATIRLNRYRSGGGAAGNVGSDTLTGMRTALPYVTAVTNLAPAMGGVDAESVDNAKLRGPQSIRAGGRAVTVSDFERLAREADSGIARVRCLPPAEPGNPTRLLVVPDIEVPAHQLMLDHFALEEGTVERIGDYLDDRRILGSKIEIGTPYYQGVTVAALVNKRPGAPAANIEERVLNRLYEFVSPLRGGGSTGRGWSFATDLNAAMVSQMIEAIEGVERVEEVLFFEYDLRNQERLGSGKELIKLAPDSLFLSSNHQVVVR